MTMLSRNGPMSPAALGLLQQQAGNKAVSHLPGLGAPMTAEQQQPASLPIYDRPTKQKKLVDAAAYELERQQLGRRLRYLATAIPKDAEEVLDAYPYESIGDKYKECGEKLQDAGRHYARGNLLLAGFWAMEAGRYTDLEIEAHRIFESEGLLSHLGKRLAFAVVGFFEGAADALLGLVDQGAGLIGYHPGLVEWNTKQYEKIKGGLGSITNIDHTHIHDDEIGRMGGKVAAGLALGKTLQSGGMGGTAVMVVAAAGGIKSTAENIYAMHERGRSWGDIFSDPVVLAQCAGALAGATIAGAGIQPLREFFHTAGLVLTAAQISTATVAIATLDNDKTLSADDKYQKMLDLLGDVLLNAGMMADGLAAGRTGPAATTEALPPGATKALPAGTAEPGAVPAEASAATKPDIHERFDVSDVEPVGPHDPHEIEPVAHDPHDIAPEELGVGDSRGEHQPAPETEETILDIGDEQAIRERAPDPFEPIREDIEAENAVSRPRTPEELAESNARVTDAEATLSDPHASIPAKVNALRVLVERAIADYRAYRQAQRLGRGNSPVLGPEALSGACGTSRDVTAENIAALARNSTTPVTIERYQINDFGVNEQHGFLIVRIGGEAFIVDPTFGQFFHPAGGTGPAEAMVAGPGGMDVAGALLRDGVVRLTPESAEAYVRGMGAPPDRVPYDVESLLNGDYALVTETAGNGEVVTAPEAIPNPTARDDVISLTGERSGESTFGDSLLGEIQQLLGNVALDPTLRGILQGMYDRLLASLPYRSD
jgi:hypothetical protein